MYMEPMKVQDVLGQQRPVDPFKDLNRGAMIGLTYLPAVQVPLQHNTSITHRPITQRLRH